MARALADEGASGEIEVGWGGVSDSIHFFFVLLCWMFNLISLYWASHQLVGRAFVCSLLELAS